MAKDLAIVLSSGGINSAVAAAVAAQKYRLVLLYGETQAQGSLKTRNAHEQQVGHFKPYRDHVLPLAGLLPAPVGSGAPSASDPRSRQGLAAQLLELLTLVALSARFAAHYQAAAIYLGLRVGPQGDDLSQAAEFIQICNELLELPCHLPDLEVMTPLLELEPWQVIELGYQVSAPFEKTWSCTEEGAEPCWACPGCRARESAFQQSAKPDPMRGVKR